MLPQIAHTLLTATTFVHCAPRVASLAVHTAANVGPCQRTMENVMHASEPALRPSHFLVLVSRITFLVLSPALAVQIWRSFSRRVQIHFVKRAIAQAFSLLLLSSSFAWSRSAEASLVVCTIRGGIETSCRCATPLVGVTCFACFSWGWPWVQDRVWGFWL